MSKPRYHWWGYVKWVIRDYPAKKEELKEMHAAKVTPAYSGMSGGSEPGRTPESLALRDFTGQKKREYEAVAKALEITKAYIDGEYRLQLIEMVFFNKTHKLHEAVLKLPACQRTCEEWHREFIRLVASFMGFMDE